MMRITEQVREYARDHGVDETAALAEEWIVPADEA